MSIRSRRRLLLPSTIALALTICGLVILQACETPVYRYAMYRWNPAPYEIYYFHNEDGEPDILIGSADWMPRNLDRRVELMVPINDTAAARRLVRMLELCLADRVKGRRLTDNGGYDPPAESTRFAAGHDQADDDGSLLGGRSQQLLYDEACQAIRLSEDSHRTGFVPHRAPGRETTET